MALHAVSVFLLIIGCLIQWSVAFGCSEKERLVRDLTRSYMTSVEPETTTIQAGISILCSRYDRTSGEAITNGWERYFWTDSRLRWEPKDYDGIDTVRLPSRLIWTPDFKLYNSLKATEDRDDTNAVVNYQGSIIWVPTTSYKTLCTKESSGTGPSCQISVGSWTYDALQFKLELAGDGVDLHNYMNATCPWTVQRASATIHTKHYPCCKEPYSNIDINFTLQQRM